MAGPRLRGELERLLYEGAVIPAHPLAIDSSRRLDPKHQRALTRYYVEAGAGGVAIAVHTTQFAIREKGLLEPVLRLAADTISDLRVRRPILKIAGVSGSPEQAVREAQLAGDLGYDLALVIPGGSKGPKDLLEKVRRVGEVLPVFGFYLQPAVGGMPLGLDFWKDLADIESVRAVKVAPFDRYQTLEVMRGILSSRRGSEGKVALYTGNDDNIVADLLSSFSMVAEGERREIRFVGGLLGQWAVWTKRAVRTLEKAKLARKNRLPPAELMALLREGAELTEANAVMFDAAHDFRGSIAGVGEVLRRQGLVANSKTLEARDRLAAGQGPEIGRMLARHPSLHEEDDTFVRERLGQWLV